MSRLKILIIGLLLITTPVFAYAPKAKQIATDTTNFDKNLSPADTTVQKALDTIDNLTLGGSETDPIFTTSAAYGITTILISNWNTAYGWGNHASAGYYKSGDTATFANITDNGLSASQAVFTDGSKKQVSNALTGSGNVVMSTSPTITTPIITAGSDVVPLKVVRGTDSSPTANLIEVYKHDGSTLLATMSYDGRWRLAVASSAPTIVAGAGAGTSPTINIVGSDSAGQIILTTGTSCSANSIIFTVTFSRAFTNAPAAITKAGNYDTAEVGGDWDAYTTSTTTTWVLHIASGNLTDNTQYIWNYHVIAP